MRGKFTVWSRGDCKHCVRAKRMLDKAGATYEVVEVTAENRQVLIAWGFKTVPQIWRDEVHIGGADDLEVYLINNGFLPENVG